jgi:hypothetical protein
MDGAAERGLRDGIEEGEPTLGGDVGAQAGAGCLGEREGHVRRQACGRVRRLGGGAEGTDEPPLGEVRPEVGEPLLPAGRSAGLVCLSEGGGERAAGVVAGVARGREEGTQVPRCDVGQRGDRGLRTVAPASGLDLREQGLRDREHGLFRDREPVPGGCLGVLGSEGRTHGWQPASEELLADRPLFRWELGQERVPMDVPHDEAARLAVAPPATGRGPPVLCSAVRWVARSAGAPPVTGPGRAIALTALPATRVAAATAVRSRPLGSSQRGVRCVSAGGATPVGPGRAAVS